MNIGNQIVVPDVLNIPFSSMVRFLIKLALASIPAVIIFYIVLSIIELAVMFILHVLGFGNGAIRFLIHYPL